MVEPQLSVRSARARELAHRLAKRERRTVAEVVERALEEYSAHQTGRVPAAEFYGELNRRCASDLEPARRHLPKGPVFPLDSLPTPL